VRKRLRRGTLHGYKDDEGGWFVLLDELGEASGRQDTVRTDAEEPIEAAYRVTPAEIEQAVSRTSAQYMGDLRTMLAEVGKVYEGQLAAKDETIAELRQRAEVAEAQLQHRLEADQARILRQAEAEQVRRQAEEAAQAAQVAPHGEEGSTVAPEIAATVWGRLRRWWGQGR